MKATLTTAILLVTTLTASAQTQLVRGDVEMMGSRGTSPARDGGPALTLAPSATPPHRPTAPRRPCSDPPSVRFDAC